MGKLSISPIGRNEIRLYGKRGLFKKKGENATIHYFSTSASSKDLSSGEYALLRELKPMRERVSPSSITDVEALLQRDLNDRRVAEQLVPYLSGEREGVAFFPAILCVLVPHGFIENGATTAKYPAPGIPTTNDGLVETAYGNYFRVQEFLDSDGKRTTLGSMHINPAETDIVVIDGQHRANALRALSGTLGDTGHSIYEAFYEEVQTENQPNFDLPVTLIWFEMSDQRKPLQPTSISRRLFVDVNNTARKVSTARTILLNDTEVESIATQQLYTMLAEKYGFETDKLSLLHSDIDIDSDLDSSSKNPLSLFSPEIVHHTFSWMFFGSERYYSEGIYQVQRERKKRVERFRDIFGSPDLSDDNLRIVEDDEDNASVAVFDSPASRDIFKVQLRQIVLEPLDILLQRFPLYHAHVKATQVTSDWAKSNSTTNKEVWDKVITSGEGLYYTIIEHPRNSGTIHTYKMALQETTREFRKRRFVHLGFESTSVPEETVSRIFSSLRTKAAFTGLVLAVDKARRQYWSDSDIHDGFTQACTWVVERASKLSAENWVSILVELKQEVVGKEANPKLWPAYQKLFLRAFQEPHRGFYSPANFRDSPEAKVVENNLISQVKAWLNAQDVSVVKKLEQQQTTPKDFAVWLDGALDKMEATMRACGLTPIEISDDRWDSVAQSIVLSEMKDWLPR